MVIIAREFAVTAADAGRRAGPGHLGERLGQAQDDHPGRDGAGADLVDRPAAWVDILVYGTVAITVLSGVDYFYRLRSLLTDAPALKAAPSSHSRIET